MPKIIETVITKIGAASEAVGTTAKLVKGVAAANLEKNRAELKTEIADLTTKKLELENQIKALQEEKENPLVYNKKNGLYYSADDADNKHPFCPACYETTEKRVHIVKYNGKCPICGVPYRLEDSPMSPGIISGRPRTAPRLLDGY